MDKLAVILAHIRLAHLTNQMAKQSTDMKPIPVILAPSEVELLVPYIDELETHKTNSSNLLKQIYEIDDGTLKITNEINEK